MLSASLTILSLAALSGTPTLSQELPGYVFDTQVRYFAGEEYSEPCELPAIHHADRAETLPWTVLLYDDADFVNAYDPIYSFADNMRSSGVKNVLVLQDGYQAPAFLYRVLADGTLEELENLGEVNMGSPGTLKYLLTYAQANFPAERYFLAVYDHGGGWHGSCIDYSAGGDDLKMNEKQAVLENFPGVDILAFTAPCLMGALESVYELRDLVDVYIGSEDLSGYIYWVETMGGIADLLENSPPLSNQEIGSQIIEIMEAGSGSTEWLTMAALKSSHTLALAEELDDLALYMMDHLDVLGPEFTQARSQVKVMGEGSGYEYGEIDLGDFLSIYLGVTGDPVVTSHLQLCQVLLDQAIINECHGTAQAGMTGLSIFFPGENDPAEMLRYASWEIDFAEDTNWNEFLAAYYEWYESGISEEAETVTITVSASCNPVTTGVSFSVTGIPSPGGVLSVLDSSGRVIFESSLSGEVFRWDCISDSGQRVPAGVYTALVSVPGGGKGTARILVLNLK